MCVAICHEASMHISRFDFGWKKLPLEKKGFLPVFAVIFSEKEENTYAFYRNSILNIEHLLCPVAF